MKRYSILPFHSSILALAFLVAAFPKPAPAQAPETQARLVRVHPQAAVHRIVFEIASDDQEQWASLLNNVENIRKAFGEGNTKTEVVAHGKSLGLLTKDSPLKERVEKLAGSGVIFAACENTMKRKQIAKEDLLPVSITTDSGVAEVVRKQEEGWAYIKSGS